LLFGAPRKQSTTTVSAKKSFDEMGYAVEKAGADGVDVARERLSAELVGQLKSKGLSVHAWDVYTAAEADRLRLMGVDSVTTDNVSALTRGRSG
jgi:glycerophosphoryl diester phosphodiesterase